jgi:hypothetical protein
MVHSSDPHDHVEVLLAEAKDRGRRRRARRRHAVLGGGGALLLLGLMAALFVARTPAGTKLNVTGPSTPSPATSMPAPTLAPTPGPSGPTPSSTAVPATAPPCHAGDLQAQGSWQGAGGSMAGGILFVNEGRQPCSVEGQPAVELFDQHGQRLHVVPPQPLVSPAPAPPVVLAPHSRPASVLVQWFNWCGVDPGPVAARVSLPSDRESIAATPPIGLIPHCNNATSPSTLDVGNFTQG